MPKDLATFITFIKFPSSMNSIMNFKVYLSTEDLPIFTTFVKFLSYMNYLTMTCKVSSLSKDLAQLITFARFLSSVNSLRTFTGSLTKVLATSLNLSGFSSLWILL